jgi:bifunctional DNA-binding transcriptional regulator/antitoxin component of YhaV-PrlF toxin-antitoxin module
MTKRTWTVPIDDEGVIMFPDDLIEEMGWEEGTVLSWDVNDVGEVTLKAKDSSAE